MGSAKSLGGRVRDSRRSPDRLVDPSLNRPDRRAGDRSGRSVRLSPSSSPRQARCHWGWGPSLYVTRAFEPFHGHPSFGLVDGWSSFCLGPLPEVGGEPGELFRAVRSAAHAPMSGKQAAQVLRRSDPATPHGRPCVVTVSWRLRRGWPGTSTSVANTPDQTKINKALERRRREPIPAAPHHAT